MGFERYVWRTSDDDRVRSTHAVNDDREFEWSNPPPTGHPGHDHNCRCRAEPRIVTNQPPVEYDPTAGLPDGIEAWYPELILVPGLKIGQMARLIIVQTAHALQSCQ
jgi:hypothetical protein